MGAPRRLTTLSVVFLLFFTVSGGAFTTEALVAEVGPGLALLLLLVVPLLWSVPEALLIGELASMLPEEGGYYRWVRRAFGPAWAFQNAWCTLLYSLVDMAIYPVLFAQYLAWFAPGLPPAAAWGVKLAVIWGATLINLRGAVRVGRFSTWAGAFVLAVFAAIGAAALAAHGGALHAPWRPFGKPGESPLAGAGVGLSIAMWNYFGWDNASTTLGETEDAARAYPRALAVAVPMVAAGYFVPLLPTLAASDWTRWREGGWPEIAATTGGAAGPALAALVALAGMVSALALYNALLLAFTRVPLVLARDGLLPAALARTDARGTPVRAVVLSAACYSAFTLLPFAQLVVADALLYALAMFLEFGALLALRRREPGLRGPFRIPLGTRGVAALAALPALVFVAATACSAAGGEITGTAVAGSLLAAALGPLAYRLAARGNPARTRGVSPGDPSPETPMRSASIAALLLVGAAALPAQTSAPRDDRRREPPRADSGRRDGPRAEASDADDYTMRRFDFGDGPGRVEILRGGTARDRRSAIGVWLGRADADGLRVERVTADGPAARAGVAAGDRLTAINGTSLRVDRGESDDPILSAVPARRLERAVGRIAPGGEVELRVARDGRERGVRVRTVAPDAVAERGPVFREYRDFRPGPDGAAPFGPDVAPYRAPFDDSAFADLRRRARGLADSARTRAAARPVLGITLEPSNGARDTLGLFVRAVAAGGPAERAGVVEGDRIATVNSVDLRVPRDEQGDPRAADARRARFTRELERLRPGDRVTLRVYGDGRWRTVTATTARSADVYRTQSFQFGPGFLPALPRTLELSPLRGFPRPVRPTRRIVAL